MFRKMKVVTLALAVGAGMVLAATSYGADTILFNGAGSSAAFNAMALAARVSNSTHTAGVCGDHNWTLKNGGEGVDKRASGIAPVTGNIWVVWSDPNAAGVRTVCAYLNIDSVVGNRLFFAEPKATLSFVSGTTSSTPGGNIVPLLPPDETMPGDVIFTLNGASFNAAPSDIRPEDALFATTRALAPLTSSPPLSGLGYGPGPVGKTIESYFSSKSAQVVDYAIFGKDPISGDSVPAYTTLNVGGQVLLIIVNSLNTDPGHLGNVAFKNVDRFVLSKVVDGTLGCTRDLIPSSGLSAFPLTVLEREPLSGTFNTFEFCVPRSLEVGSSQENGVDGNAHNPLNLAGPCGSVRDRVIGTGEMVATVAAESSLDYLGYTFFSFGNVAPAVATTKYLTVDGVDPIQGTYTGGTLPTCVAPCPGRITFPNVANGSYPIWNVLRVVTTGPTPPSGVAALVAAAQTEVANIPDFLPYSKLNVFRSHYEQSGISPKNGHLPRTTEAGGDVGGAVFTVQADKDYITDTGTECSGHGCELVGYKQ
jgi:hypothetical protein